MRCPRCMKGWTRVIGTTGVDIRERFRKCPKCGFSFSTTEAVKFDDFWKKNDTAWYDDEGKEKKE